jgi:hypothetical protein
MKRWKSPSITRLDDFPSQNLPIDSAEEAYEQYLGEELSTSSRCSICRHPQHELIDVSVLRDRIRFAARQLQVSQPSLDRHKRFPHFPSKNQRLVFRNLGNGRFEELLDRAEPAIAEPPSAEAAPLVISTTMAISTS